MLFLLVDRAFLVYTIMLFIRIAGSWIPELHHYRFMHFISFYTDPYLRFFRKWIPPLGVLDLSPIVAFIGLNFIEQTTKKMLYLIFS